MTFLLDTNVVSEWVRPRPDPGVVRWLDAVDEDRVFLSVVTLAELRRGIIRLPSGARQARLARWFSEELLLRFHGRVLAVNEDVAFEWAGVVAEREEAGRPIGAMDAFIAATARVHDLQVVTRNVRDFEGAVGATFNPWRSV